MPFSHLPNVRGPLEPSPDQAAERIQYLACFRSFERGPDDRHYLLFSVDGWDNNQPPATGTRSRMVSGCEPFILPSSVTHDAMRDAVYC